MATTQYTNGVERREDNMKKQKKRKKYREERKEIKIKRTNR
jgi:hypothetical protein